MHGRSFPALALIALLLASCGDGGPSTDDFLASANEVCDESNGDSADLDAPEDLVGTADYADEAKEVVNERLLDLDALEVPGDLGEDVDDYLDGLQEQRDTLVALSETAEDDLDGLTDLVEQAEELERDSAEVADDLGLGDCADAEEGEVLAAALAAQPDPDPEPEPEPEPEPDDEGDVEVAVADELALEVLDLGDDPVVEAGGLGLPDDVTYSGETTEIEDDLAVLRMSVPVEWIDVDGSPSEEDGTANLDGSPDIDLAANGFGAPFALFIADPLLNDEALVDITARFLPAECTSAGLGLYSDAQYTGVYEIGTSCGGTTAVVIIVAARDRTGDHTAMVFTQLTAVADADALATVLGSFTSPGFGQGE